MGLGTIKNAFSILIKQGPKAFNERKKIHKEFMATKKLKNSIKNMKDILIINGCPIEYCERYRIHHKMEELIANGYTVDEVTPALFTEDIIKYYSAFIFYRTTWNEDLEKIIKIAKDENKVIFYDIDDLVFDLEYTKSIKKLYYLSKEEKELYDSGVIKYGKLLSLCDYGITTTNTLSKEMKKIVKDVCIDKNIASLEMQKYSELAIKEVKKNNNKIIIGYASGTNTHNDDFNLVSPAIKQILDKYDNVYFNFIGVFDIPEDYKKYGDRVLITSFVDYKKLPYVIRSLDINIAPLEDTLFNRAKSCIKWMEAGFVKVPTISSDIGDFHDNIKDNFNGILCKDDEWFDKLEKLVLDKELRLEIGNNAYNTVNSSFTAITNGRIVSEFIKSKLHKKICFLLPAANISGGIMVATKHAVMLKKQGYDVTMLNEDYATHEVSKLYDKDDFINVISTKVISIDAKIDTLVATMWFTVFDAKKYGKCDDVRYLVQNLESGFYKPDDKDILKANSSYLVSNVKYITISKWCQKWLKDDFLKESQYAPNGIDLSKFPYKERDFSGKIKILIEGDPGVYYKNVDESFKITNELPRDKYEVYFLSYNAEPKDWYKVDKFYHKVSHNEVYKVYQEADILLKSSILESFSYPPLEMMATGGICVVAPNGGNIEYLEDEKNCLLYEQGNIKDAIEKIERIVNDSKTRKKLIDNGLKTAKNREWEKIEKEILKLYTE